jgi:tetratricopeptide (TPR) repeat protein
MAKVGRNSPCLCGSGKKYKKCCLSSAVMEATLEAYEQVVSEIDKLDALSKIVIDRIRSGELEEAEEVYRRLLIRYPDQVDGLDRFAMVYEAKGERLRAAGYYRKAADFMRSHPGFAEEGITWMLDQAQRLEAEHETGGVPTGLRCRNRS